MAEPIVQIKQRPALSGWPMIFAWLAMLIFAFHACTRMVGAGDTWVALACGRHFINHGVDTVEPFSANSHHAGPTEAEVEKWPSWAQSLTKTVGLDTVKYWHPTGWVNQNWLTHVIFYYLTHLSPFADAESMSFNTLVYWKFALYILTVICVYYTARLLNVNPALSAVFACFAMFVGRSFLDVRPAGFSNLLVAALLLIFVLATYRNVLYIWLMVPVVAFWCNLHGGYIYAFIVLIPFAGLHFLINLPKKWALILYNLAAWPLLFIVAYRIDFDKIHPDQRPWQVFQIFLFFLLLAGLDVVLAFFKDRLTSIGWKGFIHTSAAGFAAFIASIIFNPFHLTNLTHTFIVSLSEHAEMWRTVNEWHPAFEWRNPVGTGFPFLVLYITSIGLACLWLFSRVLMPVRLKAPKNELDRQKTLFTKRSKIFLCAAALFFCWTTFISFSFLSLDFIGFLVCALFVAVILLSVYGNIHFIHLILPLTLFAIWAAHSARGYGGRYIYPFLLLPVYVITHLIASLLSKKVKIKPLNILFVAAVAVVTLTLMVAIFNPFKFGLRFSVSSQFQSHFDSGAISQELRKQFKGKNLPLSETAAVSVQKQGVKWLITDNSKKYSVKTELGKINIYNYGSPVRRMKQIFHLRRKWIPRYEGKYRLSYANLFTVLYIINIISAIVWLTMPHLKQLFVRPQEKAEQPADAEIYQLPKIDISLIAVAALTIYMAIRSRRFIPIAAIAACPILAMFIDQIVRTISSAINFYTNKRLSVPQMPVAFQQFFIFTGIVAVMSFGTWWGLKFKRIYLDAWPTDPKLTSVFMRMTASDAKPFYALRFIKDNKMEGKMFNYWTEGGFIAWGQQPDPNDGKTPLQLFMDGRAQAAYDPSAYMQWSSIMSGGKLARDLTQAARARGRKNLNADEIKQIGEWTGEKLTQRNVWVVLMPSGQFSTDLARGLDANPNWRLIFLNNKQKIWVDIRNPQAEKLFAGITTGDTIYPDRFSKALITAHIMLLQNKDVGDALDLAIEAFELNRSQIPMYKIVAAGRRFFQLRDRVDKYCKEYYDDFVMNKGTYLNKHGYHHKTVAALVAGNYLAQRARSRGDNKLANSYITNNREFSAERNWILKEKRW